MQIDWFTLIAQIVNFLVLVWLLKRFAYGPILRAMDERKERVGSAMREAEAKEKEAETREAEYRKKCDEIEGARDEKLREAEADAEAKRKELTEAARKDVDEKRAQWHKALENEKAAFVKQLRRDAGERVYEAIRDALSDLAGADLEQRIVDVFVEKVRGLPEAERREIAEAAGDATGAEVRTAFSLSDAQREAVRKALTESMDIDGTSFETDDDLVAGIEVRAGGRKVAWSIREYLEEVAEKLNAAWEA